ncbi:MAG: single-stranded-DNA-specific exonuclease RecJ [Pseudomonadota bacterium]
MMKKRWCIKEPDEKTQRLLSRELNISHITSQVLINRGIKDLEGARRFLSTGLSHLHSPLMMKDMEKASERIISAVSRNEKITVYGDYDVDGVTALAILFNFLREINADVSYYVPHRLAEGYGLNFDALKRIQDAGTRLLITVDCGISDFDEVTSAQRNGLDVIITDHHEVPDVLPPAHAILNPKQKGCGFPFKSLAGVGIAFNLIIALRTRLRDAGFWTQERIPNLREYLDLVALGTIADIVPLSDENRIFVKFGLQQLTNSSRPGIVALKEVSGLKDTIITPGMVGFRLAPRINAAGRLGRAYDSVELLTSKDLRDAEQIARILDSENRERQEIEDRIVREAKEIVENSERLLRGKAIILASPNWHPGVMGIVASRLVEEYYKPTVMVSLDGGIGKGSARSIEAFHLYEGLKGCAHLLKGFGGHQYAAGLTIDERDIPEFQNIFEEIVNEKVAEEDFIPTIHIDGEITLKELTERFLEELELLAPFGPSNPEPIFCSSILPVSNANVVGNGHLKLKVKEEGVLYDAIGFNMADYVLSPDQFIRAAFVPQVNEWQGMRTVQLRLKDVKVVG